MSKRIRNALHAILALVLVSGMTMSTTVVSHAGAIPNQVPVSVYEMSDAQIINHVSNRILEGFEILDTVILEDSNGKFYVDKTRVSNFELSVQDEEAVDYLVRSLNHSINNRYAARSWQSFGMCVVSGFTGIQLTEIATYVNWKSFGFLLKSQDWGGALNLLKGAVSRYLVKHGAEAGAKFALKQILNSSGVGFAAVAAASAVTCAALEGWRWMN